jgi:tRNA-specific 2-thiouridylase
MKEDFAEKIVVAMSGGVDSSVAAHLLAEDKEAVVGVSMQVWDYRKNGGCDSKATCCSPDDFTDARRVAAKIGIPYFVFDFEKSFRTEVIDKFVRTYEKGETPNPCVDCNNKVKFAELRERAKTFGCKAVATGHFARTGIDGEGNTTLLRGVDRDKDQSYFLYGIEASELERTIFPVGHLKKDEVRQIAREVGLVTAEKAESQDICFVSGDVKDFLVKIGIRAQSGNIVHRDGRIMGSHDGIHRFTVGQRKGLHIGGQETPLYVLEIDPKSKMVIVGEKRDLERESFTVNEVNWVSPRFRNKNVPIGTSFKAIAQLRHRHEGCAVEVRVEKEGELVVKFEKEWTTVSPGQAAVFYSLDNEELLGGGRIRPFLFVEQGREELFQANQATV